MPSPTSRSRLAALLLVLALGGACAAPVESRVDPLLAAGDAGAAAAAAPYRPFHFRIELDGHAPIAVEGDLRTLPGASRGTPADAYFVRCDRAIMSAADRGFDAFAAAFAPACDAGSCLVTFSYDEERRAYVTEAASGLFAVEELPAPRGADPEYRYVAIRRF